MRQSYANIQLNFMRKEGRLREQNQEPGGKSLQLRKISHRTGNNQEESSIYLLDFKTILDKWLLFPIHSFFFFFLNQNLYNCYLMVVQPLCMGSVGGDSLFLWLHGSTHERNCTSGTEAQNPSRTSPRNLLCPTFRWFRWQSFRLWDGEIQMSFWTLN